MNSATTDGTLSDNSSHRAAAISEADRPTNVVFFDGVCGLCNRFVDFILSRDRQEAIRFAPLQGETASLLELTKLFATTANTEAPAFDTVVWLDDAGKKFVRSAAVVRVLWHLGGIWSLFGTSLWLVPRPLRDLGYRLVSANRYRLFGQKETCRLPTPNERRRFLP